MFSLTRMVTYEGLLVAIIVSLTLAAGCGPSQEIALTDADNGKRIEVEQGQTLAITLDSNPTTGYSWAQDEGQAGDLLVLVGEPEFTSKSNSLGSGGTETLRFRADRPGTTTLELVYRRPWEKESKPAATYILEVIVR